MLKVTLRPITQIKCNNDGGGGYLHGDGPDLRRPASPSSYRAGDDADVLGILFEPVVHVLTHRKQVVEAGGLSRGPVALRHLGGGGRALAAVLEESTPPAARWWQSLKSTVVFLQVVQRRQEHQ